MNTNSLVKEGAKLGYSLTEIASNAGVSRQRVHQIFVQQLPNTYKHWKKLRTLVVENKQRSQQAKANRLKEAKDRKRIETYGRPIISREASERSKTIARMYTRKRNNARRSKWTFSINLEDIVFPTHCPVLGLKLDYGNNSSGRKETSPSFDRINPKKGYVKNNVVIISWRANRIKNDGTPNEHALIARFYGRKSVI